MEQKTFIKISGWIFGVVAILHALRLIYKWEAIIGGFVLPLWLSGVAIVVAGYLAYQATKQ